MYWGRVSHLNPELVNLTSQLALAILYLLHGLALQGGYHTGLAFLWMLESQTVILMLGW